MRCSARLLTTVQASVAAYVDYLQQVDKELISLHEIFPKSGAVEDVIQFHSSLCTVMEENDFPLVGIKVLAPSCEAVVSLRGTTPVCVPIFSNLFQKTATSVAKDRLQYVDALICIEMSNLLGGCDSVESAKSNSVSFAPGIEVSGSRFPFYAPTVAALACDLAGCVNIAKGKSVPMTAENALSIGQHRFVLTRNQEPVQVGVGRQCMESPFSAVVAAAQYAKAMKAPQHRNLHVFCVGACNRTPAQAGTYAFEWGHLGRLTHSVLP